METVTKGESHPPAFQLADYAHAMEEVTDGTFADEVLASPVPVLVDFWAPWCKPCEAIEPHLRSLAEAWAGRVRVVRLNIDENLAVPSRYGVLSIPTVMLFADGKPLESILGVRSRGRYEERLAPFLD
jgi:thioredoxin 1